MSWGRPEKWDASQFTMLEGSVAKSGCEGLEDGCVVPGVLSLLEGQRSWALRLVENAAAELMPSQGRDGSGCAKAAPISP